MAKTPPTTAAVLRDPELGRELSRRYLSEFVKIFWARVEPAAKLVWTWHLQAICDHLQAVTEGRIQRLLINVPPGHGKSLLTCVFWPAWEWLERPGTRRIFSSYSLSLAIRDSVRCRQLIDLPEYQATIPRGEKGGPVWARAATADLKMLFDNTALGFRQCNSVGAGGRGHRGHGVVTDDPLNAASLATEAELNRCIEWWDGTMSSRLIKQETGSRVIIMQRLHERDLSGHALAKGTYEHLCLPSEFDPARRCRTSIGFEDPRTEPGELLNPSYFSASVLAEAKIDLGARGYASQHGQRPAPEGGAELKLAWTLQRYTVLPDTAGDWRMFWDLKAGSKQSQSSYAVGQVWFRPDRAKGQFYLVDQVRGRWDIIEEEAAFEALVRRWPQVKRKVLEDKADGKAVARRFQDQIPGIVLWNPKTSKLDRFRAVVAYWEAGNVYLPESSQAAWVDDLVHELTTFPAALNDDQADCMSMALLDYHTQDDAEDIPWGLYQ